MLEDKIYAIILALRVNASAEVESRKKSHVQISFTALMIDLLLAS